MPISEAGGKDFKNMLRMNWGERFFRASEAGGRDFKNMLSMNWGERFVDFGSWGERMSLKTSRFRQKWSKFE